MSKKILIIEPHSDDGIIGAGGYLLKKKNNSKMYFLLLACSNMNLNHMKDTQRNIRINEFKNYVNYFNGEMIEKIDGFKLPLEHEAHLDMYPRHDLVKIIEKTINSVKPDTVLVSGISFHHDHRAVYEATIAAMRPTSLFFPNQILIYENPTYVHSTDPFSNFKGNHYEILTEEQVDVKIKIFRDLFPSQIRESDNYLSPKSIKSWAQYRGMEARCDYAEAFQIYMNRGL